MLYGSVGTVVFVQRLDLMILEIFSILNDSMILSSTRLTDLVKVLQVYLCSSTTLSHLEAKIFYSTVLFINQN